VHIVIMGCGRVGSTLAHSLETRGHSVAIIDRDRDAFRRLHPDFTGTAVTGMGFDREVLLEAGIDRAAALAAVSNGDNSNVIAARVARETFNIDNVVARIYDPGRAEVYERLGIPTVATVRWTSDQILRRLLPEGAEPEYRDPSGAVRVSEVHASPTWVGRLYAQLEEATGTRVVFFSRLGHGTLPEPDSVIQEGDLIHVAMVDAEADAVEKAFARGPEGDA
jgi:trk system potassium uptake protein TrkA